MVHVLVEDDSELTVVCVGEEQSAKQMSALRFIGQDISFLSYKEEYVSESNTEEACRNNGEKR